MQTVAVRRLMAAGVLLLGACGADAAVESTAGDAVDPAAGEVDLDRAAVAAQQQTWLAARPSAYRFVVETNCDCFYAGTYTVTIAGEDIVQVESHSPDAERYRLYPAPTLDGAFGMLDEPLALVEDGEMSHGSASAAFDADFGYPVSFTVSGEALPSFHVEIREFTPLDPAGVTQPPGFELTISNQSFDDPDIGLTVTVDGETMIDRTFAVEGQHTYINYLLPLEPGNHDLSIRADSGSTVDRVVALGVERHYVYVAYQGGDGITAPAITVSESDQPIAHA